MKVDFRPFDNAPYQGIETPLDELCISDGQAWLHAEQMDKDCYWIGVGLSDGREIAIWIRRERGKLVMRAEDRALAPAGQMEIKRIREPE